MRDQHILSFIERIVGLYAWAISGSPLERMAAAVPYARLHKGSFKTLTTEFIGE